MNIGDKMYRYDGYKAWNYAKIEDDYPTSSVEINCTEFCVKKITPCGCWIMRCDNGTNRKHFILDNARKKFAYKTKKLAMQAFIIRKSKQVGLLTAKLAFAKESLSLARDMEKEKIEKLEKLFEKK